VFKYALIVRGWVEFVNMVSYCFNEWIVDRAIVSELFNQYLSWFCKPEWLVQHQRNRLESILKLA
jgi:hypothetical protein